MKTSIRTNRQNTGHAGCMALGLCLALGVFAIAPAMARADNYVTSSTTRLSEGTWIVEGTVTVSGRINIASLASVTLRLNEGATLNAQKGITVPLATTLTIEGAGTLNATGYDGGAGIGGTTTGVGKIVINGGTINATGSVRGTDVMQYGAAIGQGYGTSGGSVTINGGQVIATGVNGKVGIGGGAMTVTLGWTGASDFIETTGFQGTVGFAEGKRFYYAGTDEEATPENLRGGRLLPLLDNSRAIFVADVENGSVMADKPQAEAGDTVTLTVNSLYPYVLDSLTVVTATDVPVVVEQIDWATWCFVMPDENVTATPVFAALSPVELTTSEGITNCWPVAANLPSFNASFSEWYAVTEDTTLPERLDVVGNVKLYLCADATLTSEKGLRVVAGNGLTIEGEGAMVATGYSPSAADDDNSAIGSDFNQTCGDITIRGGTITATGSTYGAAIGAGWWGNGGSVTIGGGRVAAIGGKFSPGIGSSYDGPVTNTLITLGWKEEGDFIECSAYNGMVSFMDGKEFLRADNLQVATVENISGVRIIPKLSDVHDITLTSTGDGVLSADATSAVMNARITLSWTATNRYIIPTTLTVKDGRGQDIAVEWTNPSFATFVMPDTHVTVTAVFGDVGYVDVTTSDGTVRNCRPIRPHLNFGDYGAGSYAVTEDTTIGGRVVIGGDVLLYLCDGTMLTCGSGITVDGDSSLTVDGGGSLVADARGFNSGHAAGIGGGYQGDNAGTITIDGGIVTAYGGVFSAAIGSGDYGTVGTITINGGQVSATGGKNGAGLGGGHGCTVGTIAINGGQVTATAGGPDAADIGRGYGGKGGRVTLGWTTAEDFIHASSYAADVAFKPDNYFVLQDTGELATTGNINGKTLVPFTGPLHTITEDPGAYGRIDAVYADGADPALRTTEAPAGVTVHVRCSILDEYYYEREVTGLAVTGSGGEAVAATALGGGVFQFVMPAGDVTLTPLTPEIVYYDLHLEVDEQGEFTHYKRDFNDSDWDFVDSSGGVTKVREGDTVHLRVLATCPYYSYGITVTAGNGENVEVTKLNDLYYEFAMPAAEVTARVQTAEVETVVRSTSEGEQTCLVLRGSIYGWAAYSQVKGLPWYTTTNDMTIPRTILLGSNMHAKLYLGEGTTLICPGIYVEAGSTLTIEGEGTLIADATGEVFGDAPYTLWNYVSIGGGGDIIIKGGNITAKGGFQAAGIGGNIPHTDLGTGGYSGDVTISGGTIHAIGGWGAAGIGSSFRENCGVITISGGTVDAVGGLWGAGIGGGNAANGDIRISGGVVNATGGGGGAGIGGGYTGTGGTIAISGGVVNAQGGEDNGYGAGIGEGSIALPAHGTSTVIRIAGGQVTARGGWQVGDIIGGVAEYPHSAGIGLGWKSRVGECDITLGWTEESDYVDSDLYFGTVTFADDKCFNLSGTDTPATPDNINGVRIVPARPSLAFLEGDGSGDSPWLIRSERDWKVLCDSLLGGEETSGKFFRQTADISVTNMLGAPGHSFEGVFDGDGHTLTVELTDNVNECVAPFSLIDGATIANLAVAGSVSSTNNHAAGLVGSCGTNAPNVIRGCVVEANVTGGSYQGGIVGHGGQGELSLEGCVFGGSVSGFTSVAGGLMGWCNSMKLHLDNCLVKGTFTPVNGGLYHPIACKRASQTVTATVASAYYLNTLVPTASGGTLVPGAEGIPVSATYAEGEWTRPVTAADGLTYYRQPSGSYAEWAAETGIAGAWNEKDGDGVANVFRYAFDVTEGTDGMRILDLTFNDQGQVVVQTPPVVNSNGFGLSIATADDPAGTQNPTSHPLDSDGETVIDEPETGSRTRFYRLKARPE